MQNPFEEIATKLNSIEKDLKELKSKPVPEVEELLTREATAKLLDISGPTLWKWTKKGKLKSYLMGNKVYYKRSEVIASLTPLNHEKLKVA